MEEVKEEGCSPQKSDEVGMREIRGHHSTDAGQSEHVVRTTECQQVTLQPGTALYTVKCSAPAPYPLSI